MTVQNLPAECLLPAQTVRPIFEPEAGATVFDGSSLRNVILFLSLRPLLPCEAMDGVVCSALCEELSSFSQIVFCVRIRPFLILLLLKKPMGCSFLSESMKSMVTLIFKMMLKQKTKSFTG